MMALIPGLPATVVGLHASGQVTAQDYEQVVIPAIETALQAQPKIRMLYQLDDTVTGFTPGAMWDDMKVGFGHLTAWQRIAVVTDLAWMTTAIRTFGFVMPCPVRVFANSELAEANRWILEP